MPGAGSKRKTDRPAEPLLGKAAALYRARAGDETQVGALRRQSIEDWRPCRSRLICKQKKPLPGVVGRECRLIGMITPCVQSELVYGHLEAFSDMLSALPVREKHRCHHLLLGDGKLRYSELRPLVSAVPRNVEVQGQIREGGLDAAEG